MVVGHVEQMAGVIPGDRLRVLLGQVKGIAHAAQEQVIGLAFHLGHGVHVARAIQVPIQAI